MLPMLLMAMTMGLLKPKLVCMLSKETFANLLAGKSELKRNVYKVGNFSDPRPRIHVWLYGRGPAVTALLDTGSEATFISSSLVREQNLPIQGTRKRFKTANSGRMEVIGKTTLTILLCSKRQKVEAYVVDTDRFQLLMGVDVLRRFSKITLKLGEKTIKMGEDSVLLI